MSHRSLSRTDEASSFVTRATDGNPESLTELVEKVDPWLRLQAAFRMRGAGHRSLRDDVVQEAWLVFAQNRQRLSFEPPGRLAKVRAYMTQTLLFRINSRLRRELRRRAVPLPGETSSETGGSMLAATVTDALRRAERSEAAKRVCAALAALTEEDRQVLVIRGLEGASNRDAAAEIGVSEPAVAKRFERAVARLRRRLPAELLQEILEGVRREVQP